MLAVGTGLAPMSQIIQTVLNNDDDETILELLYGCRTYKDILMKRELHEWSRYWNFSCQYYLSQVSMSVSQSGQYESISVRLVLELLEVSGSQLYQSSR